MHVHARHVRQACWPLLCRCWGSPLPLKSISLQLCLRPGTCQRCCLNLGAADGSCLMLQGSRMRLLVQVSGQGQLLTSHSAVVHRTISMASILPWRYQLAICECCFEG